MGICKANIIKSNHRIRWWGDGYLLHTFQLFMFANFYNKMLKTEEWFSFSTEIMGYIFSASLYLL